MDPVEVVPNSAATSLSGGKPLVVILNCFWAASTSLVVLGALPFAPAAVRLFVRKGAGRGKLRIIEKGSDGEKSKGPLLRFWETSVPQEYFSYFYLVGFLSTLVLIQHTFFPNYFQFRLHHPTDVSPKHPGRPFTAEGMDHSESLFMLALFLIHVSRRLFESTLVEKHNPASRLHIAAYLYGLCYYVAAPLTLYVHRSKVVRSVWGLFSLHQVTGAALFILANVKQHHLGRMLANLRHRASSFDRIPVYKVPRGDWFEWVACPHYLAEILIYVGLVVASGAKDVTIWLMLSWVVANLAYAAALARQWYIAKFDDFPKQRKALIPLLF